MKINQKLLFVEYSIVQAAFWTGYCAVFAFASVFLLNRGFSATQIGITIAIGNILGFVLQPFAASLADQSKKLTLHQITALSSALLVAFFFILWFCTSSKLLTFIIYVICIALTQVLLPLVNAISMFYVNHDINLSFGIPRSIGSVSFSIVSALLGLLIEKISINVIFPAGILLFFLLGASTLFMPLSSHASLNKYQKVNPEASNISTESTKKEGLLTFFSRYPFLVFVTLAVALLFTFHNITNNYLYQILVPLGGDSSSVGNTLSIAALLELPTMLFFSKLQKHAKSKTLLQLSGLFFAIKSIAYLLAASVMGIYLVQIFQTFSFALFIPASVYYANDVANPKDAVRAQSIITSGITLGAVFASILGGILLDVFSPRALIVVGVAFAIAGAIVLYLATTIKLKARANDKS